MTSHPGDFSHNAKQFRRLFALYEFKYRVLQFSVGIPGKFKYWSWNCSLFGPICDIQLNGSVINKSRIFLFHLPVINLIGLFLLHSHSIPTSMYSNHQANERTVSQKALKGNPLYMKDCGNQSPSSDSPFLLLLRRRNKSSTPASEESLSNFSDLSPHRGERQTGKLFNSFQELSSSVGFVFSSTSSAGSWVAAVSLAGWYK